MPGVVQLVLYMVSCLSAPRDVASHDDMLPLQLILGNQ